PLLDLAPFELPRTFRARQLLHRPDRMTADLLVIAQRRVGLATDRLGITTRIEYQHRVHAFFAIPRASHHRRFADAGELVEHALDVFRKDIQSFRRDDHLLLAAADEHAALLVEATDIAGVQPAILERLLARVRLAVIPARHVLAPHQ